MRKEGGIAMMPKSILLIDDEELITKSLSILLKSQGYEVTVARSGKSALEEVQKCDFDLIICDVRMPDMDGVETIENIRKSLIQLGKEQPPEVLITGYADMEKHEKAMELKVADYLYKPFDNEEFLRTVKKALGEFV